MVRPRTYPIWRAQEVRKSLRGRDISVLDSLLHLRLLTAAQLQRLHVVDGSVETRLWRTQRVLRRLLKYKLVVRLPRVHGTKRAGAAGFVYALSGFGHAVLDVGGASGSRPVWKTTGRFQNHMLWVSELYVALRESACESAHEQVETVTLLDFDGESKCWRPHIGVGGGFIILKPDAYVRLSLGTLELAAFIEVDLGTESLPTIQKKLERYVAYWRSGVEQQRSKTRNGRPGVFPLVVLLVLNERRKEKIESVIDRLARSEPQVRPMVRVGLLEAGAELLTDLLRDAAERRAAEEKSETADVQPDTRGPMKLTAAVAANADTTGRSPP